LGSFKLCGLHVVARCSDCGLVFFFEQTRLCPCLLDLRVRGFQCRTILRQVLLCLSRVELDHHVALFHRCTVGGELQYLQVSRICWCTDRRRLLRLDLAAKLEGIDELALLHFKCWNIRRSLTQPHRAEHNSAPCQEGNSDHEQATALPHLFEPC